MIVGTTFGKVGQANKGIILGQPAMKTGFVKVRLCPADFAPFHVVEAAVKLTQGDVLIVVGPLNSIEDTVEGLPHDLAVFVVGLEGKKLPQWWVEQGEEKVEGVGCAGHGDGLCQVK